MRILQLIDSLNAGGAERMAVSIANNLATFGHQSFLAVTRNEGLLKGSLACNVSFFNAHKKHFLHSGAFLRLLKFIRREEIYIVHLHGTSLYWGVMLKWFIPKIHLIWHVHSGKLAHGKGFKRLILKFFSKQTAVVLVVNHQLLEWGVFELGHPNVKYLQNWPENHQTRDIPVKKGKCIICLANLRVLKGHDVLLKAFKEVHKNFNDWTLLLVGRDYHDAYSGQLKQYVKKHRLQKNVLFLGEQENVQDCLEEASVGVLASISEGLPVALLEYGMHRLPVVVTNVGECATVVTNNKHGFVVEPKNENAIARALISLLLNEKLRLEYGEAFYQHITQEYSAQRGMQKLIEIYEQVAK